MSCPVTIMYHNCHRAPWFRVCSTMAVSSLFFGSGCEPALALADSYCSHLIIVEHYYHLTFPVNMTGPPTTQYTLLIAFDHRIGRIRCTL